MSDKIKIGRAEMAAAHDIRKDVAHRLRGDVMSTDEHKPMIEEEIAESEAFFLDDRNDIQPRARRAGVRALAEIRRLRYENEALKGSEAVLTSDGRITIERGASGASGPGPPKTKLLGPGETVPPWPDPQTDRSLTLQNGTEVRAREVLVAQSYEGRKDGVKRIYMAVRVTAVGDLEAFTGRVIETSPDALAEKHCGEEYGWRTDELDWRPWSSVYPDRPVPGGDQ